MKAIIIFYDSLNRKYLPPYGECDTYAPNFERLYENSVKFNNSFIGSMPCMPARRELHTGRYNFLHREWGPLEPFDNSMPEMLKKSGVYTHLISDHFHYWEDGGSTYHNRYSSWEIVRGQAGDHWKGSVNDPEIPAVLKIPKKQIGEGVSELWKYDWVNREYMKTEDKQCQTVVFENGCEFIERNHDADEWLLHIETFDPHEPFYVANNEYKERYNDSYEGKHFDWPRGKTEESQEVIDHVRKDYSALVSMCDKNLGKVLDLMDKHNMWEDTMLIVGTDHGFCLGEHGHWAKNLMPYYNEVAHTPLFIYDPRCRKKKEERNSIVQMIDWAPTLLEYFNVDIPNEMLGKSLKETIENDKVVRDSCIFGVFSGHVNVTDGKHVYMRAAKEGRNNDINNYTLMPMHMKTLFNPEEMAKMELVDGFSFTKGCKLLKVPSKDKYKVNVFGNLLFDIKKDPNQLEAIECKELEDEMIEKMIKIMKENECPNEQYERLGLEKYIK